MSKKHFRVKYLFTGFQYPTLLTTHRSNAHKTNEVDKKTDMKLTRFFKKFTFLLHEINKKKILTTDISTKQNNFTVGGDG